MQATILEVDNEGGGWAEAGLKLCTRIEILVFVWRLSEIPAYRLQLSGRKPEEYPSTFTFTLNFLYKYTGRICSSCFLPDSCNWNAGISSSLQTKTRISCKKFPFWFCSTPKWRQPHVLYMDEIWLGMNCCASKSGLLQTCGSLDNELSSW